ncbi:acylneuraminate cytidylyltransferase family protein [Cellvibrio sp. KY-GH-1]|uniref:acylneuraminate cytidylyltransferase family protein n=1 Tax=Cellvibrio sp. KY-GH-1 TaxID=2303332 RepID=UPI0012491F0C|nr:acylneuraminate cytidylyltransferase family protein [Cellvibrio sp. KY-GH-1]QEY15349.1 acylneuraminate cytidylyltransferase family protein [Cellvibrio sp. KY-GH-1]
MQKVFALLPARGGSKGILQKNIAPLLDQPLIAYSIQAAQASGVIDDIYVSSDDDQILSVAHYYKAERLKRDPHLARDDSPTDPVIAEFIHRVKPAAKDIIVLLQPTSPLRTGEHIREALAEFNDFPTCHSLISVYEISNKFMKAYVGGGEFLHPLAGEHTSYTRRQDLPSLYMPNGAIYIFKVDDFLREEKIPRTHIIPYLMSDDDSLDIDTPDDLAIAAQRLRERLEDGKKCN